MATTMGPPPSASECLLRAGVAEPGDVTVRSVTVEDRTELGSFLDGDPWLSHSRMALVDDGTASAVLVSGIDREPFIE